MQQVILPVALILAAFINQPAPITQKPTNFTRERLMSGQPTIVAYAGGAAEQWENSESAVQQAIQAGVHGVQVDVQATQDYKFICHKDITLERTTGQIEQVSQIQYDQIQQFQQSVTTEYGEQYEQQQDQQQEKPAQFQQIAQLIADSDALLFVNIRIPEQEFTPQQPQQNQQEWEQKQKKILINQVLKQIQQAGLESRTIVQIQRSYFQAIRQNYEQINLMEPISESIERFEQFASGEYQQQSEEVQQQNQPDVYQAVYNFQTLQQAPVEVREQLLRENEIQTETPFGPAVEEITLEAFAQQQEQQKPVVQIMNQTYQRYAKIPVAYGVVNNQEDYEQALQLNASVIYTEKPAELMIEQRVYSQVQAQQFQFRA